MFLNATVIVQIIHFFIAYFIINQLLLKPAIRYIFSEQKQKEQLEKDITDVQKNLIGLQEQKQNRWLDFREQFKNQMPPLLVQFVREPIAVEIQPITLPNITEREKLITDLTNQIIKKVLHVK